MGWLRRKGILAILLLIPLVIGLGFSTTWAQDPATDSVIAEKKVEDPVKFGMLLGNDLKIRPTFAISVLRWNPENNDFAVVVVPTGGYGIAWRNGLLSLDALGGFEIGKRDEPNEVYLGFLLGVAKYAHVGLLWRIVEDADSTPYVLLGGQLPNLTDL